MGQFEQQVCGGPIDQAHTGENSNNCNQCDSVYSRKGNLRLHVKTTDQFSSNYHFSFTYAAPRIALSVPHHRCMNYSRFMHHTCMNQGTKIGHDLH